MTLPLEGIEALSFDLFDTLVDIRLERLPRVEWGGRSVPSTAGILHASILAKHGIDLGHFLEVLRDVDREFYPAFLAVGRELSSQRRFGRVVERLGIGDAGVATRLVDTHMSQICAHTRLPAHHAGLLGRLRAQRPVALCSNFSHASTAERVLEETGLSRHLDPVVISESVGVRKPRREIFDVVLAGLGLAPESILHVGDRLEADVAGAAAVGMRTAWVTRRVRDRDAALEAYDGPPPDLEISDLAELETLLAH